MIDLIDLFDVYQGAKLGQLDAHQAHTHQSPMNADDRLRMLETRSETNRSLHPRAPGSAQRGCLEKNFTILLIMRCRAPTGVTTK